MLVLAFAIDILFSEIVKGLISPCDLKYKHIMTYKDQQWLGI